MTIQTDSPALTEADVDAWVEAFDKDHPDPVIPCECDGVDGHACGLPAKWVFTHMEMPCGCTRHLVCVEARPTKDSLGVLYCSWHPYAIVRAEVFVPTIHFYPL